MSRAHYPCLSPQSGKEQLSAQCEEFLRSQRCPSVPVAITVWHPRHDPSQRMTSRLKRFNSAFLLMNDSTSIADGQVSSVFTLRPVFLCPFLGTRVLSSWERLLKIIDQVHQGKLSEASEVIYHVSRVGRLQQVIAQVFAIRGNDGQLLEFVISETPQDLLDQQKLFSITAVSLPEMRNCQFNWSPTPQWQVIEVDVIATTKRSLDAPFCCSRCGATKTTQRRYWCNSKKKKMDSLFLSQTRSSRSKHVV